MTRKEIKEFPLNLSVFILAAGLGERLRPITNYIPKPLLPIVGKPVLQSVLEKVSALPIYKIGINLHHKREVMERWINQSAFSKNIELFHEEPILGTGGALYNAGAFLKNSTFLVHNSDIISDIDVKQLTAFHLSSKNLATIAVHDYSEFNKLEIDEKGFLKSVGTASGKNSKYLAFTGIAVYQPEFLKFLPTGASSVVDAWLRAIHEGYKIGSLDVTGCYWTDTGTPASYAKAVINELRMNGEMVYIHPSTDWCNYAEFNGYVVIEKEAIIMHSDTTVNEKPSFPCKRESRNKDIDSCFRRNDKAERVHFKEGILNKGLSLRNCIMLPRTIIESTDLEDTPPSPPLAKGGMVGWSFENCILGPDFKIDLKEYEIFGSSKKSDAILIGTGGSDRKYYRIKRNDKSVILMQCLDNDPDFQRHIEHTRFFLKHSIPVPELISIESEKMSAFFEDLGDLSLYSWLKCPREHKQIEEIYKKVIDILLLIHTVSTEHVSVCPILQNRIFDYEHLRWETSYFIERFIEGIRNIKIKNISALDDEFHRLAMKVDSFPKTILHRDFHSQNIMIIRGGIPRILDYQGARIGPPAYDVVSLLWDPYFRLNDSVRERLLDYYIERTSSGKEFRDTLLPCRLQRHMQALGAYGFLSSVKSKKYFLKYIPEGLRLLKEDIAFSKNVYPELYNLVMSIP